VRDDQLHELLVQALETELDGARVYEQGRDRAIAAALPSLAKRPPANMRRF
jgi:hypothetical protein